MLTAGMMLLIATESFTILPNTCTDTSTVVGCNYSQRHSNSYITIEAKNILSSSSTLFAGFGDTSSNSKKNKKNTGKKVRKVVGSTGSGSKPLRIAANTFDAIYSDFGVASVNDLYVRSMNNDASTFWYVGKAARRLDDIKGRTAPTAQEAVLSQKRLILEYAKTLRPQNLGGRFGKDLEIWIAPGNSEMDTVQNKVKLEKVGGSTIGDIRDGVSVDDIGYNPEIYVGDEIKDGGLRVKRDEEGRPLKAEFDVNAS